MDGVTITELINNNKLTNLTPGIDTEVIFVKNAEVNRPALQLTGFFAHFDNERVQIMGNVECAYLETGHKMLPSTINCSPINFQPWSMRQEESQMKIC